MDPPYNPIVFPNVVMSSYWGDSFQLLDPLGGLGNGLGPLLEHVLETILNYQKDPCIHLSWSLGKSGIYSTWTSKVSSIDIPKILNIAQEAIILP